MMDQTKMSFVLCMLSLFLLIGPSFSSAAEKSAITVEAGTEIKAKLDQGINVKDAVPGTEITASVTKNIKIGKNIAIEKGAQIKGIIADASYQEGGTNQSMLKLEFKKIVLPGPVEKDISIIVTEVGYSVLPQSSSNLFPEEASQKVGTDIFTGMRGQTGQESPSSPSETKNMTIQPDGTLVGTGLLIDLDEGTRMTLRLKKPLQIP